MNRIGVAIAALTTMAAFAQKPELVAQRGHVGGLLSASFSKDGKYVVTAGQDNSARLWDAASGYELRLFEGTLNRVFDVAISPDDAYVALGNYSAPMATLFDARTGVKVRVFAGHTGSVMSVRFSPDGKLLLTGSADGSAILWDVATARPNKVLLGHTATVFRAVFSPDGKFVITASEDKTARIWDVASGTCTQTLTGHSGPVRAAAISPNGSQALTASEDGTARLWNSATGKEVRKLSGHTGVVTSCGFSPDGRLCLTSASDNTARVWNAQTGAPGLKISTMQAGVMRTEFSPDGGRILTAGGDGTARLWDAASGKQLISLSGSASGVYCCAFSPDGARAISGGNDKLATIWDVAKGRSLARSSAGIGWVNSAAFSPDGKTAAVVGELGAAAVLDAATGNTIAKLSGHLESVNSVSFSPDGKRVVTAGKDATARIWHAETGSQLLSLQHPGFVMSALFSPDGKSVLTACADGSARVWDAARGTLTQTLASSGALYAASFSPNGKLAVTCGASARATLWDISKGKEVRSFEHDATVRSAVFSNDGKQILTSSGDKTARLWDVGNGREIRRFVGHTARIWQAVFSPDGKRVMTAGEDATIRIWDAGNGKQLFAKLSFKGSTDWVVAAPDGRFDGSEGGVKHLYFVREFEVLPLERLYDKFYSPNLAAQFMGRKPIPETKPTVDIAKAKPPATVRIVTPKDGSIVTTPSVNVEVEATDGGGCVDEIRLYVNGKLVGGSDRKLTFVPKEGQKTTKTFSVFLAPGDNVLKATAFNGERTESAPVESRVQCRVADSKPELYILAVGISKYKNRSLNLRFAQPDAASFTDTLADQAKSLYAKVHKQVLRDEDATRANLESEFAKVVSQAKPEDTFVFYYSGHGGIGDPEGDLPADFYFVMSDAAQVLSGRDLAKQGFAGRKLSDLSRQVKALKQLLVIDACQAGGATEAFLASGAQQKAVNDLSRTAGLAVMMSSLSDQVSKEFATLGHGAFTYAALEALKGEGGVSAPGGKLTLLSLADYLSTRVPDLTQKESSAAQYPTFFLQGQNFVLALTSSQVTALKLFALRLAAVRG